MVHKRLETDIRDTHLPSEMQLGDSMHAPPEAMIENAEEVREDGQVHERGREIRTANYEEAGLPGHSSSHSLYARSVRKHEREEPYDFQVRVKEEGAKRDGRKEGKTHRRGNRDGRRR